MRPDLVQFKIYLVRFGRRNQSQLGGTGAPFAWVVFIKKPNGSPVKENVSKNTFWGLLGSWE
jgi:hypothetical protein